MGHLQYLATALSFFILSGIIMHTFFWIRKNHSRALNTILFLLSLLCAIPGTIYLLWFIEYINPIPGDALLLMALFYVLLSLLILLLMYKITENSRIPFMFLLYSISVIGLFQTFVKFQHFMLIISNLLLLILFLDTAIFSKKYFRIASIFGIVHSLFVVLLAMVAEDFAMMWWFIPNMLIAGFFLLAYLDKDRYSSMKIETITRPLIAPFQILFIKYILYVFALIGFMLISTVAIHESGHGIAAKLLGCSYAKIVLYDFVSTPHTEILCPAGYNSFMITMAGLLITSIIAAIFWFTEPKFSHISSLMFSIGLLITYKDFKDLGLSETILVILQIIAVILVVVSIARVAVAYLNTSGIVEKIEKEEEPAEHHDYKHHKATQ